MQTFLCLLFVSTYITCVSEGIKALFKFRLTKTPWILYVGFIIMGKIFLTNHEPEHPIFLTSQTVVTKNNGRKLSSCTIQSLWWNQVGKTETGCIFLGIQWDMQLSSNPFSCMDMENLKEANGFGHCKRLAPLFSSLLFPCYCLMDSTLTEWW